MKTSNSKTLTVWPAIASNNTRIGNRTDRSTELPLRVLIANWFRAILGR